MKKIDKVKKSWEENKIGMISVTLGITASCAISYIVGHKRGMDTFFTYVDKLVKFDPDIGERMVIATENI